MICSILALKFSPFSSADNCYFLQNKKDVLNNVSRFIKTKTQVLGTGTNLPVDSIQDELSVLTHDEYNNVDDFHCSLTEDFHETFL